MGEALVRAARRAQRRYAADPLGGRAELDAVLREALLEPHDEADVAVVVTAVVVAGELGKVPVLAAEAAQRSLALYERASGALGRPAGRARWSRRQALEAEGQLRVAASRALFALRRVDEAVEQRKIGVALVAEAQREPLAPDGACSPCGADARAWGVLEPAHAQLIQLVQEHGEGDWGAKAQRCGLGSAHEAQAVWGRKLRPAVKKRLAEQREMPCGHSCNACPTMSSCHLHDIEDMTGPPAAAAAAAL
jgi:hypothetical protein